MESRETGRHTSCGKIVKNEPVFFDDRNSDSRTLKKDFIILPGGIIICALIALNVKKKIKNPNLCLKMSILPNNENLKEFHLYQFIPGKKDKLLAFRYGIWQ